MLTPFWILWNLIESNLSFEPCISHFTYLRGFLLSLLVFCFRGPRQNNIHLKKLISLVVYLSSISCLRVEISKHYKLSFFYTKICIAVVKHSSYYQIKSSAQVLPVHGYGSLNLHFVQSHIQISGCDIPGVTLCSRFS